MKLVWELLLFCGVFTLMVKYAVRGGAIDGLYFYPKEVQDRAIEIGLTDRETMNKKKKRFMSLFFMVMTVLLVGIIAAVNQVKDFKTAYLQALLFLEVMNWYDGIVIDKVWVGCDRFWLLPGTEDLPYIQTWKQVWRKRMTLSLIWIAGAAIVALLVILSRSLIC